MKVAASPRIYMGRCPKVVFKSQVTSHQPPVTRYHHFSFLIQSRLSNVIKGRAAPRADLESAANVHSLASRSSLCYSTHNQLFCEDEREYSDGTAKESSDGWKGVRELAGSASLSRRAEVSRLPGVARYSMESEDSPRFLRRGRSEIGWNTDPPSLYWGGGFF